FRTRNAIYNVDDAPLAVEPFPVFPAITGASTIIHVKDTEATAGPELHRKTECRGGRGGRAATALHQQWRLFRRRRLPVWIAGTIVAGMGDIALARPNCDRFRRGKVVLHCMEGFGRNRKLDRRLRPRVQVNRPDRPW